MIVDTERLQYDTAYRDDMRFRFLTDHFFAAETIGFHDFSQRAHTPAVKLYHPKNPKLPMQQQHAKHKRMHLDPRHTFKTTLKRVDRLQWLCAFPEDMTVLVESATQPLALASAGSSARAFWKPKNQSPTLFQLMWPELVVEKWPEVPWNMPCRRPSGPGDLDTTLAFTSPKSTQSGWHPFLLEPDDVEDTDNSGIGVNSDVRNHVIDVCDQNEKLLRAGGFINISGTRYHPFDYYGACIKRAQQYPENWEILIRASLKVKSGARLVPGEFPNEDDIELEFPEFANLSYKALEEKFYANYESYMCQQMNDPQGGSVSRFEERFYNAAQVPPGQIPKNGETFICWRPRYGGNKRMAKYSEGAAARIVDGRIFVLDAWQGTYTASGEAEKIVAQVRQHDADGLLVIETPGSEYLGIHVRNEGFRKNRTIRIQWVDFSEERVASIEQLEPMVKSGRLLFSTAMSRAAECRTQFVHFGLAEYDGIIECIAKFADLVPLSLFRANMTEEELYWSRQRRDDALLSQFLDHQGRDPADEELRRKTEAHLEAMRETVTFSMPKLPGGLDG